VAFLLRFMKSNIKIIILAISLLTVSCSNNLIKSPIVNNSPNLPDDSLRIQFEKSQQIITDQQLTIDSLYTNLQTLENEIKFLNSSIRIKDHKEFPDTLHFVGYTFDLTNPRYREKFKYWYNVEIKVAYKYIPRTTKYFPIIEKILEKNDLHPDIKYLAAAESYLSPFAGSSAGAKGYWQFIKSTAKIYDIKIDKFVDQRRDIFISTQAACEYILWAKRYLKKMGSDDLLLALCSYNAGMGNVRKTIQEQGEKEFFKLIQRKDETDQYIWRTLVIKYIIQNEDKIFSKAFAKEEDVLKNNKLVDLKLNGYYKIDQWAQAQGTYIKKVWELNPWINIYQRRQYRYSPINDVVLSPGSYKVLIPKDSKSDSAKLAALEKQFLNENAGYFVEHTVKKGENLYLIAKRYNTTVSKLMQINNLRSSVIYPGQKLQLFSTGKNPASNKNHYVVKENDTISKISGKLGVSATVLINKNNLKTRYINGNKVVYIYPGQKLYY